MRGKPLLVIILLSAFAPPVYGRVPSGTFTNPLVRTRDSADPWMVYHGGHYYFTATLDPDGGIWVWKSRTPARAPAVCFVSKWRSTFGNICGHAGHHAARL